MDESVDVLVNDTIKGHNQSLGQMSPMMVQASIESLAFVSFLHFVIIQVRLDTINMNYLYAFSVCFVAS